MMKIYSLLIMIVSMYSRLVNLSLLLVFSEDLYTCLQLMNLRAGLWVILADEIPVE